jgi:hypothetical protein
VALYAPAIIRRFRVWAFARALAGPFGWLLAIKRIYSDLVKVKIMLGIHYFDKPIFLELSLKTHTKTFISPNIRSGFTVIGLIPLNRSRVLSRLRVKIRIPSPIPALDQPSSTLPLKTPLNITKLDNLERRRRNGISPIDRTFRNIVKGCQMAMHNTVLLCNENSRLRAENTRQKRKRTQRRAFLQTGGSMTVQEGISSTVARQDTQEPCQDIQEPRQEIEEGEVVPSETTTPKEQKRT